MEFTFTLQEALVALVLIALFILLIYLIKVVKKLIVTLTHANKILENAEVVADIVEKRAVDADAIVSDVASTARVISSSIRAEEGIIRQLSSLAKGMTSLIGIVKK